MSDELSWFRKVSFAEGWSFILLLGVAMPLKYIWGQPMAVSIVGAIHGGLFLLYGVLAIIVAQKEGWTKVPTHRFDCIGFAIRPLYL